MAAVLTYDAAIVCRAAGNSNRLSRLCPPRLAVARCTSSLLPRGHQFGSSEGHTSLVRDLFVRELHLQQTSFWTADVTSPPFEGLCKLQHCNSDRGCPFAFLLSSVTIDDFSLCCSYAAAPAVGVRYRKVSAVGKPCCASREPCIS
jgi:hypothetical protein